MLPQHQNGSQQNVPDRRHICIVTETYPPEINAVALTLAHLVEGLRLQGHTVSVIRPHQRSGNSSVNNELETLVRGFPLLGYKGLHLGLPAGAVLQTGWSRRRPDVGYVATEGPLGWSATRTARRMKIPVFSGFHTSFDRYSRHYHAGWLRPLIIRYLRNSHNRTQGTLVASPDMGDRLTDMGIRITMTNHATR